MTIEGGALRLEPSIDRSVASRVADLALGWVASADGASLGHSDGHECPDPFRDLQPILNLLKGVYVSVSGLLHWVGEDGTSGTATVEGTVVTVLVPPEDELAPSELGRILEQLASAPEEARLEALEIISALNLRQPSILGGLVRALADPTVQVRVRSAEIIGLLGSEAAACIPLLESALLDPHVWVQAAAAEALGNLGSIAHSTIPALQQLERTPEYGPRGRAAEAIAKISKATL